ncbi:10604_t:CDS:2 [Diversispora eburnea]|uniref:10604_t:CDS:1 n=1 Tax=Diversispora eburnea TaxID=1213867 RepID=A0A9N8ZPT5_9GLOM|nr:10604_t:CDS:2 [Diversispora eburnea]
MDDVLDWLLEMYAFWLENVDWYMKCRSEVMMKRNYLITRDSESRLGSERNDDEDIKSSFFKGVNWEDMFYKKVLPPFYPLIVNLKFDQIHIGRDIKTNLNY